ncbi:hypothetical protein L3Y34_008924 [Caenorhabditis briggsae]|nr:hypothetical protein L3Y34_008924 [Caenorhabditis briggsae]
MLFSLLISSKFLISSCLLFLSVAAHEDTDPELNMNTSQIIERWGYKAEVHTVTTEDGYILEMQRIPNGKKSVSWPNGKKPVVLMQHGLLACASDWVVNLPDQSAAYVFADAGFDVWLGNVRGTTYGRKHTTLDPKETPFWQFSWDEMAQYDLTAMVDHVLAMTGQENLYYMGHSQGTLIMFTRLAKDTDGSFAKKIKRYFALAPIGSVKNIKGFLSYFAHKFSPEFDGWYDLFGSKDFLPDNWITKEASKDICGSSEKEAEMCDNELFLIAGPESNQWNASRTAVYSSQDPAGTSTQNIVHWMQMVRHGRVPAFDWGKKINKKKYGQDTPPEYDFSAIKGTKIHLYWSDDDWLGDPTDIHDFLLKELNPAVIAENVNLKNFNHLDFSWGLSATPEVYLPALKTCTDDYLGKS